MERVRVSTLWKGSTCLIHRQTGRHWFKAMSFISQLPPDSQRRPPDRDRGSVTRLPPDRRPTDRDRGSVTQLPPDRSAPDRDSHPHTASSAGYRQRQSPTYS
jgi:hypothetical protein